MSGVFKPQFQLNQFCGQVSVQFNPQFAELLHENICEHIEALEEDGVDINPSLYSFHERLGDIVDRYRNRHANSNSNDVAAA